LDASNSTDELRGEVAALRASRERLVLAADAESRRIERALHDGVLQKLVALSMTVQQASALAPTDPELQASLEEIAQDVQRALDETAALAERVDSPMLEVPGRLAVALRAAALATGVRASVEVAVDSELPPAVARTVLLGWLEALEGSAGATPTTIVVREEGAELAFEIASGSALEGLRDRVEALGGSLTVEGDSSGGVRASGRLPLARER
jgi:signal transduction histidine kinase